MRIVHVNGVSGPEVIGGAERFLHLLAHEQMAAGHDVEMVALGRTSGRSSWDDLPVVRVGVGGRYWPERVSTPRPWRAPWRAAWHFADLVTSGVAAKVAHEVSIVAPDVIHVHNVAGIGAWAFAALRAAAPGAKLVWTAHDYWVGCVRSTLLDAEGKLCRRHHSACLGKLMLVRRAMSSQVDAIVTPSDFLARRLAEWGIAPRETVRVIRNGVPDAWLASEREGTRGLGGRIRFLFLGQLEPHKGVATLLDAADLAGLTTDQLWVAGKGTLEGVVRDRWGGGYLGFLTGAAIEDALSSCDALVVPSEWYENCPLVILEAMVRGLAVVGATIGGIPEIVRHGRNGLLVKPGNASSLAAVLRYCLEHPDHVRELGQQGRREAEQFGIARVAREYEAIYGTPRSRC